MIETFTKIIMGNRFFQPELEQKQTKAEGFNIIKYLMLTKNHFKLQITNRYCFSFFIH